MDRINTKDICDLGAYVITDAYLTQIPGNVASAIATAYKYYHDIGRDVRDLDRQYIPPHLYPIILSAVGDWVR